MSRSTNHVNLPDGASAATAGQPGQPLLVNIEGAAEILAISRTSIYQLVWRDELVPIRIGRSVRFSIAQLEAFVTERIDD